MKSQAAIEEYDRVLTMEKERKENKMVRPSSSGLARYSEKENRQTDTKMGRQY